VECKYLLHINCYISLTQWAKLPKKQCEGVLFLLILHSKYSAAILSKIHSYRLLLWFPFLIKRFFFFATDGSRRGVPKTCRPVLQIGTLNALGSPTLKPSLTLKVQSLLFRKVGFSFVFYF